MCKGECHRGLKKYISNCIYPALQTNTFKFLTSKIVSPSRQSYRLTNSQIRVFLNAEKFGAIWKIFKQWYYSYTAAG